MKYRMDSQDPWTQIVVESSTRMRHYFTRPSVEAWMVRKTGIRGLTQLLAGLEGKPGAESVIRLDGSARRNIPHRLPLKQLFLERKSGKRHTRHT